MEHAASTFLGAMSPSWKPWRSMSNTNDEAGFTKIPNFTDTLRLFKVGKSHQILQTSLFHPFVISASHSPEETCEKLCPPMLLSNDDVAWLNWEPDIQAAPEPQKTRSWLCLTQWLMLETQWQTPNVATLCHVQQHLLYHISIHYPSLHSNVEKNGALGPKMVQQNPLLSFQPSYFPRNHVPTMVPAETQVSQGTAQEPGPQPGSVQARTLGLFP